MLDTREDGIVDVVCDTCGLRLTEVITNPMPMTKDDAAFKAWNAGWTHRPDHCVRCQDVQ